MKSCIAIVIAVLITTSALTACGQKGPLFLPGHNPNPPKPLLDPGDKPPSEPGSDSNASPNQQDTSKAATTPADRS